LFKVELQKRDTDRAAMQASLDDLKQGKIDDFISCL